MGWFERPVISLERSINQPTAPMAFIFLRTVCEKEWMYFSFGLTNEKKYRSLSLLGKLRDHIAPAHPRKEVIYDKFLLIWKFLTEEKEPLKPVLEIPSPPQKGIRKILFPAVERLGKLIYLKTILSLRYLSI